ncbi:MAG: ATPase [Clostridiales bacterium]|jgi:sugar (pentulose or hexulose) kinase|nr:ATPase [Clostridiales bacterium]
MHAYLGIELGSTRVKAVLINDAHAILAQASINWENQLVNGVWTYALEDAREKVKEVITELGDLPKISSMGVSAMMHGYLAFDKNGNLLTPFRTWRNTLTEQAAAELTSLLEFNLPQRWSAAHLYQDILDGKPYVKDIAYMTTLAGYTHYMLTGEKALGIGDASGMFPIREMEYDKLMAQAFDKAAKEHGANVNILDILPHPLVAGKSAGAITQSGSDWLGGLLKAGTPMCPPEGDAGTGMTATNSVTRRTGNISAGTSVFAMAVLEKPLAKMHPEIDVVTTPEGAPTAMVHCNNCTTDIDAWVKLFAELSNKSLNEVYELLYTKALQGDADCGGLVAFNYDAGEPITNLDKGRPMLARIPGGNFSLANLSRCLLYSATATLKIGMDILTQSEGVKIDGFRGHGGFFKTTRAGQQVMAAALNTPVTVMKTAGEGGAWGMAILAAYMINRAKDENLGDYLNARVFKDTDAYTLDPEPVNVKGFAKFLERYANCLPAERSLTERLL